MAPDGAQLSPVVIDLNDGIINKNGFGLPVFKQSYEEIVVSVLCVCKFRKVFIFGVE